MFKGKCSCDQTTLINMLSEIMDKLDEVKDSVDEMTERVTRLENDIRKIGAPAEKLQHELVDAKAQMRHNSEFMQGLVLQLIAHPPKATGEPEKKVSPVVEAYLAKKAETSLIKPKLP